jgi:molybdopterin-guanine dinucleotide biosynthesis protein A
MRIAGAIIAGGLSSRMAGQEKIFSLVGQSAILDRVIASLNGAEQIIMNANGDPERFAGTALTVVADVLTGVTTPLSGLHASLVWAARHDFDWLLTVPADTPFLPPDLVPRLIAAAQPSGAAIATSSGQGHFIIGAWRTALNCDLEQAILTDHLFRVKDWAARANAVKVAWPIQPYDPFFNVNTPDDLAEARRIAAEWKI